jgi:FSR family fosmidomycin resistance protein-like MFS transporter
VDWNNYVDIDTNIDQEEFQTAKVSVLASAHAVHDTYTAFLPALLPVLIEKFTLTNTAAGLLTVFLQIPSLLQPIIGRIADRRNLKLAIVLTPAVTGAAMSFLGIAPSYGFLIVLLLLAGLSSASLHAVAPVLGSTFSGNKLGRGMSFWMVGGELGRALGPIIIVTAIGFLELEGLPWLMVAGILMSIFLYNKLNEISTKPENITTAIHWKTALQNMRSIMGPMAVLLFTRSMVSATLTTFLPTFLKSEGASLWVAGASLTILQVSGMVGALLAGSLSDRFGRRRMLFVSYFATPILMFLFIQSKGILQIPLLMLLGFFAISIVPVLMAVVIENFSDNRSFANGIYMALSFVLQAIATLMVGFLSDLVDLRLTFMVSAALLPAGLIFIHFLPKTNGGKVT